MASLGSEDESSSDFEGSAESDSGMASTHCMYLPSLAARTAGRRRLQETSESSSDEEQLAVLNKKKYTATPVLNKDKPTESPASCKDKQAATPCRKGKGHSDMQKKLSSQLRKVVRTSLHPTPSRVVGRIDPLRDITRPQTIKENVGGESRTLQILEKTNGLLSKLVSRVKKTEERIRNIEEKLDSPGICSSSSSSSSTPRRKSRMVDVPNEVKREVKRIYKVLLDEEEDFEGFCIGTGFKFKDQPNQRIVDVLMREVKALNPEFLSKHINAAAYRYYLTLSETESDKRRGIMDTKKKRKRRRERLTRKTQDRKAALEKMVFTDEDQRGRWLEVMKPDFMSSEESDIDGEEDVLVIRTLPWRSSQVNQLMQKLDDKCFIEKRPLARRQTKHRITGTPSSRPVPLRNVPGWAIETKS